MSLFGLNRAESLTYWGRGNVINACFQPLKEKRTHLLLKSSIFALRFFNVLFIIITRVLVNDFWGEKLKSFKKNAKNFRLDVQFLLSPED